MLFSRVHVCRGTISVAALAGCRQIQQTSLYRLQAELVILRGRGPGCFRDTGDMDGPSVAGTGISAHLICSGVAEVGHPQR